MSVHPPLAPLVSRVQVAVADVVAVNAHRHSRTRSASTCRSRQPPPDGGYGRPREQGQQRAEHETPHRPLARPVVAPHDAPSCPDPALAETAASAALPQVVGSTHSIQVRLIVHSRHWPSR